MKSKKKKNSSTIVSDLLLEAHQKQKINFSVVVVDSKPRYEGNLFNNNKIIGNILFFLF